MSDIRMPLPGEVLQDEEASFSALPSGEKKE
jgi:hypothetical protein